jgi:predicted DNA-binding transcriptional regulator YafY
VNVLQSALLKVRAVLPRDHQERISRLARGLATTANVKTPAQANLSLLQQALANLQVLSFSYQSAEKASTTERIAEPCGLIHYLERWHLIAWCRASRDYRDFRTDRMTNVTALRETFTPREDFSVAQYIRAMPAPTLRAQVKFTPLAADRAKREWWLGVVDEVRVSNGIVLTLAAVEWENLVRWLLSFEREATVLTPESLRKSLVKAAENAAAHHMKKPARKVS